jgi:hypothetical protein
MKTKNLTIIIALVTAATLSTINLNAAEPAPSPQAKTCHIQTAPVTTADPNLLARNPDVAASPKVLANFPQMAKGHKPQTKMAMAACSCCKP